MLEDSVLNKSTSRIGRLEHPLQYRQPQKRPRRVRFRHRVPRARQGKGILPFAWQAPKP